MQAAHGQAHSPIHQGTHTPYLQILQILKTERAWNRQVLAPAYKGNTPRFDPVSLSAFPENWLICRPMTFAPIVLTTTGCGKV